MISHENSSFCRRWVEKADKNHQKNSLEGAFDGFFNYFVAFNCLYVSATFELADQKKIGRPKGAFPDGKAAKSHVLTYVGSDVFAHMILGDKDCVKSIDQICDLLENKVFSIKLDRLSGNRQPAEDLVLLTRLKSKDCDERSRAILDLLYSLRCNLFHGRKGFETVQKRLLDPAMILLRRVIVILFAALGGPLLPEIDDMNAS